MDIKSAETRDVTKTRTFVTLKSDNGNEDEFRATKVLKFVKDIIGTDEYMEALISLSHTEKKIAEMLKSDGLVSHSQSTGWYEDDR